MKLTPLQALAAMLAINKKQDDAETPPLQLSTKDGWIVWRWKSGRWRKLVPTPANGANGRDGKDGATGATGASGQDGAIGPQGPQGVAGPKGDKGDPGEDAVIDPMPSSPSRALNTTFMPSGTRPTFICYTVEFSASSTLSGGANGVVELFSDTSATPSTLRTSCRSQTTVTLGVTVNITTVQRYSITYLVPAGHNVRLVSSGNATITMIGSTEVVL